jgi:hypothetical protein
MVQFVSRNIRSRRVASTSARTKYGVIQLATLMQAGPSGLACAGSSRSRSVRARAANSGMAAALYWRNSRAASSTRAARSWSYQ